VLQPVLCGIRNPRLRLFDDSENRIAISSRNTHVRVESQEIATPDAPHPIERSG
jgi:hypothetical protein